MSLINEHSNECIPNEIDLYSIAPTQTIIEDSIYVRYYPLTSISQNAPLEFLITTSNDTYIDLYNTLLYTKSRILLKDGSEVVQSATASDKSHLVAPQNNFHSTQFKNVEVFLNNKLVSTSDNLYPFRSYLETLLTFSESTKNNQLALALYHKDTGTDFDTFNDSSISTSSPTNKGLYQRYQKTKLSKPFETIGKLHSELFLQPKFIPGGTEIRIKITKNEPAFCLQSASNNSDNSKYIISMDSAILMVKQCTISPFIVERHLKQLEHTPMKFPIKSVNMKFFTKSSGRNDLSEQNIVNGVLPEKIIVGFLDNDAFSGKINKSCFNFKDFGINTLVLRKNGTPCPYEKIEIDATNNFIHQGYLSLIHATNKFNTNDDFGISPNEYKNGYVLFGFDLTSNSNGNESFNLIKEGKISLEVKLGSTSSNTITMIVYLQYQGLIEIDKQGEITQTI